MRVVAEAPEVVGFDKRVTHRDARTGQIIKKDPYIKRVCAKESGGSVRYYERPAGSGNLWDAQGNAVGRWDITKPEGQRFVKDAKHVAFERPKTEDEKLENALLARENENAVLKAELEALKAEQAKKSDVKSKSRES